VLSNGSALAADVKTVLDGVRAHIKAEDFHLSGRLVRVNAKGDRVTATLSIRAHWFPDALRVWAELGNPSGARRDLRTHVLIEMRPNGESTIRAASPGDTSPHLVPDEKWNDGPLGGGFALEDLIEQQYFWPDQSLGPSTRYGARDCDVLKSKPGTAKGTVYAAVVTWLDQAIHYPVYAEKTLKGGGVKEFTYLGLSQNAGVWFAHEVEVKLRGQAGSTLMIVERGSPRANLTAADFKPELLTHF